MRFLTPEHLFRRRVTQAATVVASAVTAGLISALPAYADPCGGTNGGPQGGFDCSKSVPGSNSGGGGSAGGGQGGSTGTIPTLTGADAGGFQVNTEDQPAPTPSTLELAQQASDSAQLPVPKVHTSPEGKTYVQVRTGLWVEGFTTVETEPINVGGQNIQATASPKSVTWNLGDTTLTCSGPGSKNDTTCSHIYGRSSAKQPGGAYQITATIVWSLSWTCAGAACDQESGTLEDMTMTSPPTPLVVGEIQTNTRS